MQTLRIRDSRGSVSFWISRPISLSCKAQPTKFPLWLRSVSYTHLGISAVRGGSIVGEHEVIFAGPDEVIEFKHTAYSKAVFGKGAVEAAKYLAGKPAGRYDMSNVIEG